MSTNDSPRKFDSDGILTYLMVYGIVFGSWGVFALALMAAWKLL
jgi:hypothetical protein